ncbi:hypothetical protein ARAM_003585 [Aspergillus rambellii]|uniref:N-acetyltransferase domain-containing protein n=1 Tax=Aspergillus rambellii TaxID=308745 RepID=A0A0F8WRA8_9EURO|nr:hypothetical protein ARAM_003585 [Aspergillus rambellii]
MARDKTQIQDLFRTKRLLFRAAEETEEDKAFLNNQILNDPLIQTMSTMRLRRPLAKKSGEDFIKTLNEALLGVMVCLRPDVVDATPTIIGHLALLTSGNHHHRSAMLGLSFAEPFRGKGYGGEAINWALDWAFESAALHRVSIGAFSFNTNALKLYRKVGFVDEGREREAIYYNRSWHDVVNLSMLEHEWENLRRVEQESEGESKER